MGKHENIGCLETEENSGSSTAFRLCSIDLKMCSLKLTAK